MMKNIMFMIMNLVKISRVKKKRKRLGIIYACIIGIAFVTSHYLAANYVSMEEPADLFPPYVEKSIAYPELYKNK